LEQFRPEDLVCRWGGDEFLAVLSSESGDAKARTRQIADRLGGRYSVKCAGRELVIDVGVSAGAAEYAPGEVAEELFARADVLLYKCKGEECAS
jgi:diguanylate cyclase (GGDEF)-like protein